MPEWILTKDQMPKDDYEVVIWFENDYEFAGWVGGCDQWDVKGGGFVDSCRVDRWSPLPGKPK